LKVPPSCIDTSHSTSPEITSMLQDGVVPPIPDLNRTPLAAKDRWSTTRSHGRLAMLLSWCSANYSLKCLARRRPKRYGPIFILHPSRTSQMPICIV
jgi:hypothetical protein